MPANLGGRVGSDCDKWSDRIAGAHLFRDVSPHAVHLAGVDGSGQMETMCQDLTTRCQTSRSDAAECNRLAETG